jgi:hypothetical protein
VIPALSPDDHANADDVSKANDALKLAAAQRNSLVKGTQSIRQGFTFNCLIHLWYLGLKRDLVGNAGKLLFGYLLRKHVDF